jgi:hypothetical protein
MAEFAYAVHTDVCTYLLDDSGVCLWVLSPNPSTAKIVEACVGAQFVACSDTRVPGGLTAELALGAAALFVSISKTTGRPALLRTGPIRRVQIRNPGDNTAPITLPQLQVIADEDLIDPPTMKRPSSPPRSVKRKGDSMPPPPLPRTQRRKEPEEPSITLVTYPGGPLKPPVIVKAVNAIAPARPSSPLKTVAEDAAPLPLRNKRKK